MKSNDISSEYFKKRLVDLCLRSGMTDFPNKYQDQLILLKSIANMFTLNKEYTENEVNEVIKNWQTSADIFIYWDFMMLRRRLVDVKLLGRNPNGSCYWLNPTGPEGIAFDPAINQVIINEVLSEGRRFIAQKKAQYLVESNSEEV